MREAERTIPIVAEWVAKAEPVEKHLKAYVVYRGTLFPKTHDIEELVARLPSSARPALTVEEQALLTEYAVGPRCPGWRDVPLREVRQAVALARRVRKHVRSLLPKGISRRRKH